METPKCCECSKSLKDGEGLIATVSVTAKTGARCMSILVMPSENFAPENRSRVCGLPCLIKRFGEAASRFMGVRPAPHLAPAPARDEIRPSASCCLDELGGVMDDETCLGCAHERECAAAVERGVDGAA